MVIRTARVESRRQPSVLDQCVKNIFYTVLVQNIENRKLHRQVDLVDAGLNQESKSHVFFSVWSLYCIYESFQEKIIHAETD